jgi:hypothetical protein
VLLSIAALLLAFDASLENISSKVLGCCLPGYGSPKSMRLGSSLAAAFLAWGGLLVDPKLSKSKVLGCYCSFGLSLSLDNILSMFSPLYSVGD